LTMSKPKIFGDGLGRVGVVEITPNLYWLSHCLGDHAPNWIEVYRGVPVEMKKRRIDIQFSSFLFVDKKTALIDTLGPMQRTHLMEAIEYVLDGKKLDYVWISHTELPHAGNANALRAKYPGSKVIAANGGDHYEVHGLEGAMLVDPGDKIKLGSHTLEIVDPLFVDHGLTQWVYEQKTGFMCTVDWALNFHVTPSECFKFLDELEESLPFLPADLLINMRTQFPWLAWTNPEQTNKAVDKLFAKDVRILAPMHGAIVRKDMPRYAKLLKEAMRQAATMPFVLELKPATKAIS
jgi:flavorubredoxin